MTRTLIVAATSLSLFLLVCCGNDQTGSGVQLTGEKDKKGKAIALLPKSGLCALIELDTAPVALEPNSFKLGFWKADDCKKDRTDFIEPDFELTPASVKPWMPEHGHGSSKKLKFEKKEVMGPSGKKEPIYQTSNLVFTMPGNWVIRFTVKKEEKEIDSSAIDVQE